MALKYDNVSVPISLPFTLSLVGLVVAAVSFVAGVSTASVFSEFLLTVLAGAILAVNENGDGLIFDGNGSPAFTLGGGTPPPKINQNDKTLRVYK